MQTDKDPMEAALQEAQQESLELEEEHTPLPPSFHWTIMEESLHNEDTPYVFWATLHIPILPTPMDPSINDVQTSQKVYNTDAWGRYSFYGISLQSQWVQKQGGSPGTYQWSRCVTRWCQQLASVLTTFTQIWVLQSPVWNMVMSSRVTQLVPKDVGLSVMWLRPTFPMYLGSYQECGSILATSGSLVLTATVLGGALPSVG